MQSGWFALVMATGIVSVGAEQAGRHDLSWALFGIGAAAYLVLAVLVLLHDVELRHVETLTFVAGTGVLGARLALAGDEHAALALWALAAAALAALAAFVVLDLVRHEHVRRSGTSLLAVVAPESLAVLGAILGRRLDAGALTLAAEALWAAGLAVYALLAPGIARRLVRSSFRPEDWVAMGALAIATVAAAELALATATTALWAAATAWLPVVALAELRRGVRRFEARRWATVFPLGMYAVATYEAGAVDDVAALGDVAIVAFWIALAAWTATAAAMLRRYRASQPSGS